MNNVIRKNDLVRIVNPIIVERCGYPLTKQIIKDTIFTDEQKRSIYTLMLSFGINSSNILDDIQDDTHEKILDIMAWKVLKKKGFGGPQRQLFTIKKESLRGKSAVVVGRKVVKTGKYFSPSRYFSNYDGEYDYEPGGLSDEKTHVLLQLSINPFQDDVCPNVNSDGGLWIEKINLERYDLPFRNLL